MEIVTSSNFCELYLVDGDDLLAKTLITEPLSLLEYVGGMTVEECAKEKTFVVQQEIENAWEQANDRYNRIQKNKKNFCIRPMPDNKYIYFYRAIENPERIAGLLLSKYVKYLKEKMNIAFNKSCRDFYFMRVERDGFKSYFDRMWFDFHPTKIDNENLKSMGTLLKPGKAAALMGEDSDKLEIFAGYLQDVMYETSPDKLDILTTEYPSNVYTMPHDDDVSSCMVATDNNYINCDYFDIYDAVKNCSIAYITEEDRWGDEYVVARALLWENVHVRGCDKTIKLMDRIYYASNRHLMAMERWAKRNGYWHKAQQALGVYDFIAPEGGKPVTMDDIWIETNVTFSPRKFRFVPYVDTFSTVYVNENIMSSQHISTSRAVRLTDTEGDGDWLTYGSNHCCYHCGDELDRDHFISDDGDHLCDYCRDKYYAQCEKCGEWFRTDSDRVDYATVDEEEQWICRDCINEYEYCGYSEEWWSSKKMVTVKLEDGTEDRICKQELQTFNFIQCEYCGEYFHKNRCVETRDGWVCEDCKEHIDVCPCCHEYSMEDFVYNHNLKDWVCPACLYKTEPEPVKEEPEDPDEQLDLFPHGHDGKIRIVY